MRHVVSPPVPILNVTERHARWDDDDARAYTISMPNVSCVPPKTCDESLRPAVLIDKNMVDSTSVKYTVLYYL